ncbi:MAG: PRD domain-containing protein [Spirochaetaceae bacterium]|jgi:beta-glucoside operon transcriptional antiterminator|nr:PRD domain-containing protein [Spirochaetaceae bacterium]
MTNIRKCNNNIILAIENGQEVIVLGKGIGFNIRPGDEVDPKLVEKVFVPKETAHMNRFQDILADLPYEQVLLASKIVDYGKTRLDQNLNQSIVIALADHLNFAINRLKDNLDIQMPLAWDIKHIYPTEFAVGKESLKILGQETGIAFPEEEAAAIALHFINAESDFSDMPNTIKMAGIIKKSVEIVEDHYKTVFNENLADFNGFIALLRNTILRFIYQKNEKQVKDDIELHDLLSKRYARAWACAEKVASFIEKDYGWRFTMNDISFLTLYISRITGTSA